MNTEIAKFENRSGLNLQLCSSINVIVAQIVRDISIQDGCSLNANSVSLYGVTGIPAGAVVVDIFELDAGTGDVHGIRAIVVETIAGNL